MTSNLDCVGLGVTDRAGMRRLVDIALAGAERLGEADGVSVLRWQDPSGARLVLGVRGDEVVDLLPSYAGTPGARLADVRAVNEDVAVADVLDDGGEQATMLAAELEQRRLLPAATGPVGGLACVVALGVDVAVYADAEAFAASDASLVGDRDDPGDPPAHVVEQGWPWPPRMATESFVSYGVFGEPAQAQAYARLNGTVLGAEPRTVTATGQRFVAARVRTAGFEADVCLPAGDAGGVPQPGNVVAGTVFLVGSLPVPTAAGGGAAPAKRSWLPWRR
ncbi:hypothetical protein [Micromonospora eburnea]|uniref:Uncharacterized protein n=1 Tax=Micromonospora eburnea TaxID=227316 RepID=A0A1C6UAQ2_9ACTN|nr:hypothetical protein [Micromonospora eburnea]SCL51170.1 hypothetical protein GA0070604_2299 [Micromonospora eburnea]